MPFEPHTTVHDVLTRIQQRDLVLPAIQREFVWDDEQICVLFDSLMRGYPIGQFLSWEVEPETAKQFRFYEFLKDFHEWHRPHNPEADLSAQKIQAVLDGQQRLTSLNIGLRGSYAARSPYKWEKREASYPLRHLYLNLVAVFEDDHDSGMKYDFRMLTTGQVATAHAGNAEGQPPAVLLFPVSRIFDMEFKHLTKVLAEYGVGNDPLATEVLPTLFEVIHQQTLITFFSEKDQSIDRVLDIFIRVNSQGTTLSYSDLLLSIATAQWQERDARRSINDLIDRLNNIGGGYDFRKDLVLKAGLMLVGVNDIGFKVKNFNAPNMDLLQAQWDDVAGYLETAVNLLADFGLTRQSLPAASVVLPIAYYLKRRSLSEPYRTSGAHAHDRALLRSWVLRSQILPGIWGSGLDRLLRDLRAAINDHGANGFPVDALEARMSAQGKSLVMNESQVDDLLALRYGQQRTFATLAILFPHVNTRNVHHVDHFFPRSLMHATKLRKQLFTAEQIKQMQQQSESIVNLQLIEGPANIEKSDTDPGTWLDEETDGDAEQAVAYLRLHDLPSAPRSASEFAEYYDARSDMLRKRIKATLRSPISASPDVDAHAVADVQPATPEVTESVAAAAETFTAKAAQESIEPSARANVVDTIGATATPSRGVPGRTGRVTLADLHAAGLLPEGTTLRSFERNIAETATVGSGGVILLGGGAYTSPSTAAGVASGGSRNGWTFWHVEIDGRWVKLNELRFELEGS